MHHIKSRLSIAILCIMEPTIRSCIQSFLIPVHFWCCAKFANVVFGLCRSGFCRFSSSRYTTDKANMKNLYMHLTNVAIQKKNDKYDENTGMKWPISKLKQYLLSKHGLAATSKLFGDIQVHMLLKSYSVLNLPLHVLPGHFAITSTQTDKQILQTNMKVTSWNYT